MLFSYLLRSALPIVDCLYLATVAWRRPRVPIKAARRRAWDSLSLRPAQLWNSSFIQNETASSSMAHRQGIMFYEAHSKVSTTWSRWNYVVMTASVCLWVDTFWEYHNNPMVNPHIRPWLHFWSLITSKVHINVTIVLCGKTSMTFLKYAIYNTRRIITDELISIIVFESFIMTERWQTFLCPLCQQFSRLCQGNYPQSIATLYTWLTLRITKRTANGCSDWH